MKKIILIGVISILFISVHAQFIDNYGIKLGVGLSNQYWQYKNDMFSHLSEWNENKTGVIGQIYAEKKIGKHLSFQPAIGYIQKGFTDDLTIATHEEEALAVKDNRVILHNLALDLAFKAIPFNKDFKPYLKLGLRTDYLMGYRSVLVNFQGKDHEMDTKLYDDFNKFTLGAILGVGISYKDLLFIDLNYNPPLTKNFESDLLAINDRLFSLTFGVNINQLIKQKNE